MEVHPRSTDIFFFISMVISGTARIPSWGAVYGERGGASLYGIGLWSGAAACIKRIFCDFYSIYVGLRSTIQNEFS